MRAVVFNGSTYIGRSTGGWTTFTSTSLLCSFWIRFRTAGTGLQEIYSHALSNIELVNIFRSSSSSGSMRFLGRTSSATTTLDQETLTAFTDTNWHHVLFRRVTGSSTCYIDGSSAILIGSSGTSSIYWPNTDEFHMGTNSAHTGVLNAELADFWLSSSASTLDISQQSIRELFIKDGKPVPLGNGIINGVTPRAYHTAANNNWMTNLGDGNNWSSVESGSLSYVETPIKYAS